LKGEAAVSEIWAAILESKVSVPHTGSGEEAQHQNVEKGRPTAANLSG